jgi:GTP-binding protein
MVEIYLRERRTLKLVVLILDIRREPSLEDRQLVQWLSFFRIPFRVVLTKRDKVSSNEFVRQRAAIAAGIGIDGAAFVPFSAKSGTGKEHLWREIRSALETGN